MFLLQPPSINWFSSTAQPIQQPPKPNTPIWSGGQGGKYCRHYTSALTLIGAFMQMYHLYGDGASIIYTRPFVFIFLYNVVTCKEKEGRNISHFFFTSRQLKKYDVISPSSDTLIRSWGVGREACWAWAMFCQWSEATMMVEGVSLFTNTYNYNSHLPKDTQILYI